jgi:hypothetical protein
LQIANRDLDSLQAQLSPFLNRDEIGALARRAEKFASIGYYPHPDPDRRPYPWPQI